MITPGGCGKPLRPGVKTAREDDYLPQPLRVASIKKSSKNRVERDSVGDRLPVVGADSSSNGMPTANER
jgi:hypothetical protein